MNWWKNKPRKINLVFDQYSWIEPYVDLLLKKILINNDKVKIFNHYEDIELGDICFFLGCTKIASKSVLDRAKKNLVVHESDLPLGRGFSPLTWQILEGKNSIPVALIEINEQIDSGNIIYKENINFSGHELNKELKDLQGNKTIELCLRYLDERALPIGVPQSGETSYYKRRVPEDSRLSLDKSLKEQFNLLRVVDNERYPAFFEAYGNRYILKIEKDE